MIDRRINEQRIAADIIARYFLVYIVLFRFFSQKAEFLVLVFYFRGCSDNILAFHNFYQKVRNKKVRFLCSIFPKLTLTFSFSSTPTEVRLTCTVVRPFGIVAIGIKAARV